MRWTWIKRAYSLRALVITINLAVLALPIIGIASLRIFENVLHRQTEVKLIAEGAYVQALYIAALSAAVGNGDMTDPNLAHLLDNPPPLVDDFYRPQFPQIDLTRDKILAAGPDGLTPETLVNPAALEAGAVIQPILREVLRYNLSGVIVLDDNGVVVASTGGMIGQSLTNRHEVRQALAGHYCSVLRERELGPRSELGSISRASRVRVYVAIPILYQDKYLAGVVYLHRTSLTFLRDLWERRFATALIIVVVITIAISLLLASLVTRPLNTMITQAQRIAAGESGVSLKAGKIAPVEAHELSQALSEMLTELKRRYNYVEEFTKNVSHEFKTPLAGIQGAIELLRDGWPDMSEADRARFLTMIDTEVKRMERLVKRLIALTRIELAQPADASTDIADLLEHMARRYMEAGQTITLVKKSDAAPARIAADMAETLFTNLIDNALTHGKGAPVTVELSAGPVVEVKDAGPGISPANLLRIFDRFFTTARDAGGTGLGLAMVKAICEANGAEINVHSDEQGTVFKVAFKPMAGGQKH
ncbi:MAG TPA: HAMP domain-containing sensor histidine kinase [bacterium]|nr:HAMP domain-containing sensor histidine kinase [bacterium]